MAKFDLKKYLSELEYLVNIDSNAADVAGVQKVADYFKQRFAKPGWFVEERYVKKGLGPCLAISNTDSGSYDLLLLGHMDTVFPAGTASERPFKVEQGYAYGPGVNDMKAGALQGAYVLEAIAADPALQQFKVCLALNPEEEQGSRNVRSYLEELSKRSRYVIVLEPSRGEHAYVNERKGLGRFTFKFHGVASHAGTHPEDGRSAITEMAYWIGQLTALTDFASGLTINVGTVKGGTATNVVADYAQMEIDVRLVQPEQEATVQDCIAALQKHAGQKEINVDVTGGMTRPPMPLTDKAKAFMVLVEKVAAQLGRKCVWVKTGGGSDGNFSAALGIPTLDAMGPYGEKAHSAKEYLEIADIEPSIRMVVGVAKVINAQR